MLKLLVPVDGSERSLQAVRHAAFLFQERCAAEVVLLNVQPRLEGSRLDAFHSSRHLMAIERSDARHALAQARRILDDAKVRHSTRVQIGPVAPCIVRCADEERCDEIVLAAPRPGFLHAIGRLFSRSLLDQVALRSPVPVTAVR
jgi:nucleotide-binding universal stress UspA family protein